ncbi:MAG: 16S rRNA (cytosine(1402)-N(4))-methyltransferase RsmH [Thermomicrobiales bacterium]
MTAKPASSRRITSDHAWDRPRHLADGGHFSVLLDEAVAALAPKAGGIYLDGTFGGGGHSRALLEVQPPIGQLWAVDADPGAIARATTLATEPVAHGRLRPVHGNFGDLAHLATANAIPLLDGILLDLGVSSFQLDEGERGFSFRFDAPLDMRFDPTTGISASEIVNGWDADDIANVIWRYGEERQSRTIARAILAARADTPIVSTGQLAAIVSDALGGRRGKATHPATKTFQALRIAVNEELEVLPRVLAAALDLLASGGRLVVIAFHSLEDRIVKQFVDLEATGCVCPPEQPVCTCGHTPRLRKVGKPVKPSSQELDTNARSRSAIMRVAERLPDADAASRIRPTHSLHTTDTVGDAA